MSFWGFVIVGNCLHTENSNERSGAPLSLPPHSSSPPWQPPTTRIPLVALHKSLHALSDMRGWCAQSNGTFLVGMHCESQSVMHGCKRFPPLGCAMSTSLCGVIQIRVTEWVPFERTCAQ
eukprot:scaffold53911_cov18-Tisochrysis_lutea.AAC.1